jgi:hypothetical protein
MPDSKSSSLPVAVYVHLGPDLPPHLKWSLDRHQHLFPNQELVLITSHDQHFDLPEGIKQFKVNTDELETELFDAMSKNLDFDFRKGFWKYTLQRFFAVGEFHKVYSNRILTHIESDVLLMPNFPWQKFTEFKKLAWLKVNSKIDVAAIVHFPTLDKTLKFLEEISQFSRMNPDTNDMLALHEVAVNLKHLHEYLPSLTPSNAYNAENFGSLEERTLSDFGGIFDPLNLGLWYFGQDPKNSFGLRKRYVGDTSHDLNPIHAKLKFHAGVLSDISGVSIFSLHIHSKHLPLFGKDWESSLEIGLVQALTEKRRYSFHLNSLFLALRGRKIRQNLWILISLIPGLSRLRRIRKIEALKDQLKRLIKI